MDVRSGIHQVRRSSSRRGRRWGVGFCAFIGVTAVALTACVGGDATDGPRSASSPLPSLTGALSPTPDPAPTDAPVPVLVPVPADSLAPTVPLSPARADEVVSGLNAMSSTPGMAEPEIVAPSIAENVDMRDALPAGMEVARDGDAVVSGLSALVPVLMTYEGRTTSHWLELILEGDSWFLFGTVER